LLKGDVKAHEQWVGVPLDRFLKPVFGLRACRSQKSPDRKCDGFNDANLFADNLDANGLSFVRDLLSKQPPPASVAALLL
jgi:hypothetical protein